MNDQNLKLAYWQKQEANINGMLLNPDALEIDERERVQIIGNLPELSGKSILELGAGIGRYTSYFASQAKYVNAVDFNQKFIDKNKENNSNFDNTDYQCCNVMELSFAEASFDFVFVNWLFMYLEDDEVKEIRDRIHQWLKLDGQLFFRESCITDSKGNLPLKSTSSKNNLNHSYSHYREPKFYLDLFTAKFKLELQGNIAIYEQKYNNPNQLFYLFRKKGVL
ncbi:MAG: methyltransferase domain-containing protein [Cyanobacteriota bacterium]|nr:methyltransferase domain-containing protein [Cyanobacteriota bacterium]